MMIKRIIALSVLIVLLNPSRLRAQSGRNLYFSRCLSSEPLMFLDRMSVQDCRKACAERNPCLAVSYHKFSQTCQLYNVITSLLPCTGFNVLLKREFQADDANTCSGSCPISDCNSIPSVNNAETFGNMLNVGAVIKVKCINDDSVSYIECQPNGQWTQLPICPSPACTSYNSLKKYNAAYILKHNVGDSNGMALNETECLKFCEDSFGDTYLSIDHAYKESSDTNCYCGSVNRQQVLDSSPEYLRRGRKVNLFSKTCD